MINVAVISASSAVIVPDLSGKTSAEVLAILTAAELTVGTTNTTTSGANGSNTGTVATQTIAAGTRVERYSSVGYSTYYYQASPPPPPPTVTCTPNGQGSYYAGQGVCSSGWAEDYNCSDGTTITQCTSGPPAPPPPSCTPVSVPLGGGCYYVTNADCTTYYSPAGCNSAPPPPPNPPAPPPSPTCTPSSTYMGGGCYAITYSDCSHGTSCG